MVATPPRSLENALREETDLAEIGAEYTRTSAELVGAARVEASAAGGQYRLLHRMWQLADEVRKQRSRVECRWLRSGASAPDGG